MTNTPLHDARISFVQYWEMLSRRLKANLSYDTGEPIEIHDTHGNWLAGWLA